jgi:hypothetical protein
VNGRDSLGTRHWCSGALQQWAWELSRGAEFEVAFSSPGSMPRQTITNNGTLKSATSIETLFCA